MTPLTGLRTAMTADGDCVQLTEFKFRKKIPAFQEKMPLSMAFHGQVSREKMVFSVGGADSALLFE